MCQHSSPQQPNERITIDASVDLQQGVAFALVLHQGRRCCPLPVFSGRIIKEVPGPWKWGVSDKDKKKIKGHLAALQILKERGMKGSGIIGAYHMRRVAPLMAARTSPAPNGHWSITRRDNACRQSAPPSKVAQHIKEAMEPSKNYADVVLDFVYPVPGHPPMRPKPGFTDFISSLSPCLLFTRIPEPLLLTLG